ncbi:hypothetical protein [Micromonospora sp. CPCC 205556]|uniref:hypothetical protein n=1 Tax=Micromonospora sp. CPCC 205556 TaxID=3122398 RepID=UPI002FEF809C
MSVSLQRVAVAVAVGALGPVLLGVGVARAGAPPVAAPALAVAAPTPSDEGQSFPDQNGNPQPPPGVVFVEVRPSMVQPGFLVGLRASCRNNAVPAIVVSDAFGRVQVQPQRGELTSSAMVRERTRPGNYRVKLECPDGATAATMLQVVEKVRPSPGPQTGFGGGAGLGPAGLLVPGGLALTIAGATVGIIAARRPRGVARR